jgi:L-ascorbate metabolism protein UlaG (beta-lactamase superfamily)
VYGSVNTCQLARTLAVPENQVELISANDELEMHGIQVKVIPAGHPWIPGYTSGQLRTQLHQPLRLRDYRMDSCLSFLITFQGRRVLVWSSISTDHAETADVLICRAVSNEHWYERMLTSVQPRLVIPSHWDDMFHPLSKPPRPYFSPPCQSLPPIRRIDLGDFERKVKKARPDCEVLLPERFREYHI